jgi:hypothetical protein
MISFEAVVYFLCFLTSGLCAYLLVVAFARRGDRLLLWSAICFCLLAANNLLVFIDIILLPSTDLTGWRSLTAFLAVTILLFGFIWEVE